MARTAYPSHVRIRQKIASKLFRAALHIYDTCATITRGAVAGRLRIKSLTCGHVFTPESSGHSPWDFQGDGVGCRTTPFIAGVVEPVASSFFAMQSSVRLAGAGPPCGSARPLVWRLGGTTGGCRRRRSSAASGRRGIGGRRILCSPAPALRCRRRNRGGRYLGARLAAPKGQPPSPFVRRAFRAPGRGCFANIRACLMRLAELRSA